MWYASMAFNKVLIETDYRISQKNMIFCAVVSLLFVQEFYSVNKGLLSICPTSNLRFLWMICNLQLDLIMLPSTKFNEKYGL